MNIENIAERIINEAYCLTPKEALEVAQAEDIDKLLSEANRIRLHFLGRDFDTCSIMNAQSGRCSEDCKWCSQSVFHKSKIEIYPLVDTDKALNEAEYNAAKGIRRFSLVTSGRRLLDNQTKKAASIYRSIGERSDISLCASMGLVSKEQLEALYSAGVRRYHCNVETAPSFFPTLCSTHTIEDKIQTITWAKEVGMEICSGGIIGMGETIEQRVEMAILLRDIGVDSIPINILNPISGTQLENCEPLSEGELLRTFAMFRFVHPKIHLRFAGGRAALGERGVIKAINGGISGAMLGDLLTTVGSDIEGDKRMFRGEGFEL